MSDRADSNLRFRWAYELATHQRILDYAERILGPDIVLWAMVFWYKEPHNSKYIPWHQDATYWPMEPRINLTAWMALGPTFPGKRFACDWFPARTGSRWTSSTSLSIRPAPSATG